MRHLSRKPVITVQVVTCNRARQSMRCIESIQRTASIPSELLVVDNASADDLRRWLFAQSHATGFGFTQWNENRGYGEAHNFMAKQARGDYICVVTNDITFGRGWMEKLMGPFRDQKVAQTCPVHVFNVLRSDGLGCTMCEVEPHLRPLITPPEYADGALFMIRKSIVDRMGNLFDPAYRMGYCEDADLSLRLRQAGYKVVAVPGVAFNRDESEKTPPPPGLEAIKRTNNAILRERHGKYLSTRRFT